MIGVKEAMMIEKVVETWREIVAGERAEALDGLLADDVVFYSPIVHTPQHGKAVTIMYLSAAAETLSGDPVHGAFHYTKQVFGGDVAMLEFETTVVGKYVNGVDIIRCDNAGHIVELRVMIRPLQAINAVHDQMQAMLASMAPQLQPNGR
jgi:ketosteroid isomerase-like protein